MIDPRAVTGGSSAQFLEYPNSLDAGTQPAQQSASESLTEEMPSNQPQFIPAWQQRRGIDDPLDKSMTLLSFKRDAPGKTNATGGATTYAAPSPDVTRKKIDDYFDKSNNEYKLPDGTSVKTQPSFRMNVHDDGQAYEQVLLKVLKPQDQAMKRAIHMTAYGRATPQQIQQVTQALIDKGAVGAMKQMRQKNGEAEFKKTFPNTNWPLSDADAVKLLQSKLGIGVDCAGYVQQEFLAVHGGTRADYGFQSIGDESLSSLKGNKHFSKVGPTDVQPGDLMILDAPAGETVGHTVMVQDRHVMTNAERSNYPGIDAFAKPGQKVHVITVEASFGGGANGDPARGGVQRRAFLYNEDTKQWADMRRDWDQPSAPSVHISDTDGPYDHPMNGIYHPNGK